MELAMDVSTDLNIKHVLTAMFCGYVVAVTISAKQQLLTVTGLFTGWTFDSSTKISLVCSKPWCKCRWPLLWYNGHVDNQDVELLANVRIHTGP